MGEMEGALGEIEVGWPGWEGLRLRGDGRAS